MTPSVAQQPAAGVDEELVEQWNGCWEWLVDLSVVVDPEFTDEVTRRWPRYQALLDTHQVDAWQWRKRADPPPGPGIDPRSPPAHRAARDLGHRLRDAGYWKQAGPRASVRVTGLPVGGRHSWLLPDRHLIVSREVFLDSEHLARLVQQAAGIPSGT